MSAHLISFSDYALKQGEFSLLEADLPGHGLETIGVLLLDPGTDTLYVRLRRDFSANEEDTEVLAALEDDLLSKARETGGAAVLEFLETTVSNSIRITDREAVDVR